MSMRAPVSLLLALVLGVACATLVACGSKDNPHLLSAARGDRLSADLDKVRDAVSNHDCQAAQRAVQRLEDDIATLPRDTDPGLRQRLTETTPTQTETTPTQTQTQTQTTPTQTETTPTQTETTPTTPTTTTPTTTTPDSGGSTVPPG
jgi:hypothetical protein